MAENFAGSPLCRDNVELKKVADEWHKAQTRIERQSHELVNNSCIFLCLCYIYLKEVDTLTKPIL